MSFAVPFAVSVDQLASLPEPSLEDAAVTVPWGPLARAVEDALSRGETHYTDRPGIFPLRQQVSSLLNRRFGVVADPQSTIITCSVIESRFVALQQLIAPGDAIWTPACLVDRIAGAVLLRRAVLAAGRDGAHLIYLASSLGEAVLREHLEDVSDSALILFEVDDSAGAFHPLQLPGLLQRTLSIGPLGYASWQLGYLIAPARLSAGLRDFKQALTICSTNLSQWAALAALECQ